MIKKMILKNLSSSLTYNGIGQIRFYNGCKKLIESGDVVKNTSSLGETVNFSSVPSEDVLGTCPVDIINTNSTIDSNWHSSTMSGISIEITFKKYIDNLSAITIIPRPTNIIGVTNDFEIEFYDYDDVLLQSYAITPITEIGEIQTIITDELMKIYEVDTIGLVNTTNVGTMNNIEQILYATVTQDEPENTKIRYLFSIDNKSSYFSIVNGEMKVVSLDDILTDGMSKEMVESISDFRFDNIINLDVVAGISTSVQCATPILHDMKIVYI